MCGGHSPWGGTGGCTMDRLRTEEPNEVCGRQWEEEQGLHSDQLETVQS